MRKRASSSVRLGLPGGEPVLPSEVMFKLANALDKPLLLIPFGALVGGPRM